MKNKSGLKLCLCISICNCMPAKKCCYIYSLCLYMRFTGMKGLLEYQLLIILSTVNLQMQKSCFIYYIEVCITICFSWSQRRDSFQIASLLPSGRAFKKKRWENWRLVFRHSIKFIFVVFQAWNLHRAWHPTQADN